MADKENGKLDGRIQSGLEAREELEGKEVYL